MEDLNGETSNPAWQVRMLAGQDREWVRDLLVDFWGATVVVSRGQLHHADQLPGFVATNSAQRLGLVTYRIEDAECEIVTLNSLESGQGIGTALIEAVRGVALSASCHRLWLVTTNDNTVAQEFYYRRGFVLATVHRDAVEMARRLKPQIPLMGHGGVSIRDEFEFEMFLR